jgi:hypothetical protein
MGKFEYNGFALTIGSHLDNEIIEILRQMKSLEKGRIYFSYTYGEWSQNGKSYPNENDLKIINNHFNKNIILSGIENWWIPLLPNVEKFEFDGCDEDIDETIKLLKNNNVTALRFRNGPKKKFDLTKFLVFKDTLEDLYLDGNYKNIEILINGAKKLKNLEISSMKIDFNFIKESSIEYFYYYGSKTKEWDGIVKFNKLKHLYIKANITMENLDFLQKLLYLETIEFLYCSKIKAFPNLENLKNLKKIFVFECKRLEDISEIKKLKNIETNYK